MGIDIVAGTEDETRAITRAEVDEAIRRRWPEAAPSWDESGEICTWHVVVNETAECFVHLSRSPFAVSAKNFENVGVEAAVWLRQLLGPGPRVFVVNASSGALAWIEPESTEDDVQSALDNWHGYE